MAKDWTEPNVCIDENLTTDSAGLPQIQPWAVPRLVADAKGVSGGDGKLLAPEIALPGKLLIDIKTGWLNESPREAMLIIRVTRAAKRWITSNPNAIQFRDRFTYTIDPDDQAPTEPVTTSIFDSQCGSAIDLGTNSVAEPLPGKQWVWSPANSADRIVGPVLPGDKVNLWYRCYVWTPPPFSDNANKNQPLHEAYAQWARVQMIALPEQGTLVLGSRSG